VVLMGGFATSFHILYRRDQDKHEARGRGGGARGVCGNKAGVPCLNSRRRVLPPVSASWGCAALKSCSRRLRVPCPRRTSATSARPL
jgi:hypothetical protein